MSAGSTHHRAKHRSGVQHALSVALVFGLTLASAWSNPFDWSPAQAGGPSPSKAKIQPLIVDFATLAKQKAEARKLLDAARKAAAQGDLEDARCLADQAAAIAVEWNLGETSPKKFLSELATNPKRVSKPMAESSRNPVVEVLENSVERRRISKTEPPRLSTPSEPEVIELAFPDDRPGTAENAEEDLSLTDAPSILKVNTVTPSRSASSEPPKTLRTLGFKTDEPASLAPPEAPAPRKKHRFDPIPSLEELSDTAPAPKAPLIQPVPVASDSFRKPASTSKRRSVVVVTDESDEPASLRQPVAVVETAPLLESRNAIEPSPFEPVSVEPETVHQKIDDDIVIPGGRLEDDTHMVEQPWEPRSLPLRRAFESEAVPAMPTTVIHEFRVAERPATPDQTANLNSTGASQLLMNLNSLMMAGIFGALLLLIVVAVVVLRKFGPNPQFTFKVEVNHPHGIAALAPTITTVTRTVPEMPLYSKKRQLQEELEDQQEDAMMRQVFEDNLKLREQLDQSSIAA